MLTPYRKILFPFLAAIMLVASAGVLTACDDDNAAEQTGEKIDEGLNDAKRAVEDATD